MRDINIRQIKPYASTEVCQWCKQGKQAFIIRYHDGNIACVCGLCKISIERG